MQFHKQKFHNILFVFLLFPFQIMAQLQVEGYVFEKTAGSKKHSPLPGATVYLINSTTGTITDTTGFFRITVSEPLPVNLVISYVGFRSDTLTISKPETVKVFLQSTVSLSTVTIEGKQEATLISTIKPINTELIGQKELLKAACCNLSESFETNPSVNVSYTDAITGAKEIQMLGLSGIYSQIMTENIPNLKGLAAPYGLNYIPGPWMESIQVTKGSGSVANGFESTTGQINVEYRKPEVADPFYLNVYGASSGNIELNAHQRYKVSENSSGILFVHGENSQVKWDHQDDGFLDMPMVSQANIFNRWSFNDGRKFEGQLGIKAIFEKRRSGQTFYNWGDEADTTTGYGVQIETMRLEAFSKTGMVFPEKPWKSVGLILSGSIYDLDSYFGLKTYDGRQNSFYGSLIYMSILGTTNHKWKTGLDMRYDDFSETYLAMPFDRIESVPGIFAEYTLNLKEKFGFVAGSRVDYHNDWGWFYTPRLHMKYNFTENIIIRASGGRSFRTANVFSDNISMMATSRDLVIEEKLNPERAWNFGSNFTAKFKLWYRPASFSVDYYLTDFSNQVIIDTYSSTDKIEVYNLEGSSFSKSFQVALNYEVFKRFDVRLAYKNDEVVMDFKTVSTHKPLVPENRGLLNISYGTIKENWRFDFTTHYVGETRLAIATTSESEMTGHDDNQVKNGKSPDYLTFNAQVSYITGSWEFYTGGENLTSFRQEIPVYHASHPFEEGFDAANVWGPVMGVKIYAGLRFKILAKKNNNESK